MNKQILEKEVEEYNQIVESIQKYQLELNKLEQQRLIKLGRIQLIEENLEENSIVKDIKIDEIIKDVKKKK